MKKLIALTVLSILFLSSSYAQDAAPKIDPKASEAIKKFSDFILASKSVQVNLSMNMKIQAEGMNQEIAAESVFAMERPNKVYFSMKKGMKAVDIVCDGKSVYTYVPSMKQYMDEPAGEKFESLRCLKLISQVCFFPISDAIVADNPAKNLMEGVTEGSFIGIEKLGETECQHLAFKQDEFDWDVWIQTGDKPVIRKVVPNLMKKFEKMATTPEAKEELKKIKQELVVNIDGWTFGADVKADLFKFTPPADAKKAEPKAQNNAAADKDDDAEEPPHPSLGKDAPVFKLETLDGGTCDIAAIKGKNIIVLDFWATWCPPCRKALPVLAEVTSSYADKGVVFYAVNLQDPKDKITDFLAKQNIKCQVALDKDSEAAKLYNVEGIPQSVIIGKDGIVQVVHVGLLPDLKDQLKKELDDLVAGKSLIKKDAPAPKKPAEEKKAE